METIYLNKGNLARFQKKAIPSVMALGCFDGLHLGHRKVIETAIQIGKTKNKAVAVMSFFPHPKTVIGDVKQQVQYLMPMSEKEKCLKEWGVDLFYVVTFDYTFASLSPQQFVKEYLICLNAVHVVAGYDFSYGFRGKGNMDRLQSDSGELLEGTKVEQVSIEGKKVSSTSIRKLLNRGAVKILPKLLGHYYKVNGTWDGKCLTIHPYYTLPCLGYYLVFIRQQNVAIKTVIILQESKQGYNVKTIDTMPFVKGVLSIEWQEYIPLQNIKEQWKEISGL